MLFDGIPVNDFAAGTLVGIAVLLIFTGRLVPRHFWKDKSAEADRWRLAYEIEREARITSDEHNNELLELAKTTHAIVVAAFTPSVTLKKEGGG